MHTKTSDCLCMAPATKTSRLEMHLQRCCCTLQGPSKEGGQLIDSHGLCVCALTYVQVWHHPVSPASIGLACSCVHLNEAGRQPAGKSSDCFACACALFHAGSLVRGKPATMSIPTQIIPIVCTLPCLSSCEGLTITCLASSLCHHPMRCVNNPCALCGLLMSSGGDFEPSLCFDRHSHPCGLF